MFIGGGAACLGVFCSSLKNNRLKDMVLDKHGGVAILEKGTSFGGGALQHYLINSNTSGEGFLYCLDDVKTMRRAKSPEKKRSKSSSVEKKKRSNTLEPKKTQMPTAGESDKV
jgi:hypothetical protein